MRKHEDYVKTELWFAWHPVKTEEGKWVWWETVERTIDERPLVYLGLLEKITYNLLTR